MNTSQKKLEKSKGRLEIKIIDQNLEKLYQQGSSKDNYQMMHFVVI